MSLYDKASLVLIPSGTKTSKVYSQKPTNGDGDFTFSRSTAATRVNASGNIEKETENLLLQSNFSSSWSAPVATMTGGQSGYDGSSDAWLLSATGNFARIEQTNSSSGVVTLSVYAKAGTADWIMLRLTGSGFNDQQYFDLANGAVGINRGCIAADIEDVGGGWYRCSATTSGPTLQYAIMYIALADGNLSPTNENIYIQDAQLEQGLVARDYIETTTTAIYGGITDNVPRLDYTDSSCPALLLEPQRTNVLPQSEYYGASGWDASAYPVTITSNSIISPDGNSNATLITPTSGNSRHAIREISISAVSGATYTLSVFFKKGGSRYVVFGDGGDTLWRLVTADLDNGVITDESNASGTITPFANGWYRITCQITRGNSGLIYFLIGASETDSNSTLPSFNNTSLTTYSWGAQVESNASYPTSYIPTYGSAVTRNADAASKTGVSSLIGQTEGTLFFDVNISRVIGNEAIGTINSGAYANHATIQRVGNTIQFVRNSATQSGATIVTSATITAGRYKLAIAYKSGDTACFLNGTQVSTTQTQTFTNATLNAVKIGTDAIGALPISDSVKQSTLFKERLSNAELATLTTI